MTDLLDGLDTEQRAAVIAPAQPLRIIAPAGSGKTRVLTRRIAHQATLERVDPRHCLALTFTRKSASELRTRLRALGLREAVVAGTFHAVALAQLRDRWQERNVAPPTLLDNRFRLVARVAKRSQLGVNPSHATNEIDWAKARGITPDSFVEAATATGRPRPDWAEAVAEIFAAFEDERNAKRLIDFDDLLSLCVHEMEADSEWAQAQRWRFRHFFVDEFQDVNPLQFRLLSAWLGPRRDLCVVGDADQAIYAWNGADAGYLIDFERHFPDAETVSLQRNYRSTAAIVGLASSILESGRHARPMAGDDGPVPSLMRYEHSRGEAHGVVARLLERRGPSRPLSHHAVLARTNGQLETIAEALDQSGIGYRIRSRSSLLDDPIVTVLMDEHARDRSPLATFVADRRDDPEPVAAVVALARDHLELKPAALTKDFLATLAAADATAYSPHGDAVDLSTFHAAKGLEWPIVHLVGLEEGFVPISHANTTAGRSEEQRLLYVAITRARRELHCSWAEVRTFGDTEVTRRPSPWLDIMARRIELIGHTRRAVDPTPHLERNRRILGHQEPSIIDLDELATESAEASLRAWRLRAARAARVAPQVVFTDETLREIVGRHPVDLEGLAQVPGLGRLKIARHGQSILAALTTTAEANR